MVRRLGRGCCSGCIWLFAIALLVVSWQASPWSLRALELLLLLVVVLVAAAVVQSRRPEPVRPFSPREG